MANQTLTTAANFDDSALLGLGNGESITINGGALTIDSDVRWGQNAAVVGAMAISTTLGGSILIDGSKVWELPFTATAGTVPAQNALGSNTVTGGTSGATGELLRVWNSTALIPMDAGFALPATGTLKLRSKTGTFQTGEVVTLPNGSTVTISSAGKRSWVHVVGGETTTVTVPRLGTFTMTGDWYELGTTNGADDQAFKFPVIDYCPAIQVETAPGSGVYEWWLNAGDRWGAATQYVSTDVRGKFFYQNGTDWRIRIAQRASNACGYKPASGCKVRIPNIICSSSTSASWTTNTLNATLTSRYDFTTTSAGKINIDRACMNWYLSCTSAYEVIALDSCFMEQVVITNTAADTTFTRCAVGLKTSSGVTAMSFSNLFTNLTLTDCRAVRYFQGPALAVTDAANVTVTRCAWETFGGNGITDRSSTSINAAAFTRAIDLTVEDMAAIGGRIFASACTSATFTDTQYADKLNGNTTATNGLPAFWLEAGSNGVVIDGYSNFAGLANVQPYTYVVQTQTGCLNITVRNIGTPDAPWDAGGATVGTNALVNIGVTLGVTLRRLYAQNTRGAVVATANTAQNVVIDNVWGDAADSQAIAALTCTARGCRWTNSVTGQTSVYGRHWEDAWTGATTGRLLIACNEPLPATADQAITNFTAGSGFTSTGSVSMVNVGDYVEWVMPYFMLGATAFANIAPTITGTNTGNHSITFQYDTGSGWNGSWLAATGANLSGIGAINPATGVKLKVRATVTAASTSNALTYIRFDTVTNATDQKIQYPLPGVQLTIQGFATGSDVTVLAAGTETVLANAEDVIGTSYVFDYNTVGSAVDVSVYKPGYIPAYIRNFTLPASNSSLLVSQMPDPSYLT